MSDTVFVISSTCATAEILESASPLKPREETDRRSSTDRILLVEWRKKAKDTCSFSMPERFLIQ